MATSALSARGSGDRSSRDKPSKWANSASSFPKREPENGQNRHSALRMYRKKRFVRAALGFDRAWASSAMMRSGCNSVSSRVDSGRESAA